MPLERISFIDALKVDAARPAEDVIAAAHREPASSEPGEPPSQEKPREDV